MKHRREWRMDEEHKSAWMILRGAGILLIALMGTVLAGVAIMVGFGIGMGLIKL